MKFGFYLPTRGHTATPEALETLVTRAEALGFHSVMIADHVVFPMEHFASVIKPAADRL
jgi:alkanesulfonate monooxygenase SsuD/methylene tetrahydromethanopterin reductase-like flavin-dependent oxidoreductase (luciferase family)